MRRPLYSSARAFLRAEVLDGLVQAQKIFDRHQLTIKIWDVYRPFSVQEQMWASFPNEEFLARPIRDGAKLVAGSKHSRGAAIDLTLVDAKGNDLPMPSYFDDFSEKAKRTYAGECSQAKQNMVFLEKVLSDQGFLPLPSEWWHFDWHDWEKFELLDFIF